MCKSCPPPAEPDEGEDSDMPPADADPMLAFRDPVRRMQARLNPKPVMKPDIVFFGQDLPEIFYRESPNANPPTFFLSSYASNPPPPFFGFQNGRDAGGGLSKVRLGDYDWHVTQGAPCGQDPVHGGV